MNQFRNVYIGKTPSGEVICDVDPQVLNQAQAELVSVMPFEEFQKAGNHRVEITVEGGVPRVALTAQAEKAIRKKQILTRLDGIDKLRVRPIAALASGESEKDKDYLNEYNAEADLLREELAAL
jgi:hypothetical protein